MRSLSVAPPDPPSERNYPSWYTSWRERRNTSVHHPTFRVARMLRDANAGSYRVPAFQRDWKWSDADILHLLDSLQRGYHVGTLIVWERYNMPASRETLGEIAIDAPAGRGVLVVDGQQRLGALMTAAYSGRFWFDLQDGRWIVGDAGPWRCPSRFVLTGSCGIDGLNWEKQHAAQHDLDERALFIAFAAGASVLEDAEVSLAVLPADFTLDEVVDMYRRLNSAGVRMTPEDLEHALRCKVDIDV